MTPVRCHLMSRDEEQLIRLLLSYDAPAMKKRGLQNLCAALERGRQPLQREPMIAAIGGLKDSEDVKVRRWFYKAVALRRATDLLPQITYQVLFSETDPENVSWAVTALFSIAPPEHAARVVKDRKLRFFETHLELAAQLFTDGEPLVHPDGQLLLFRIENDPLTAKWFTLLFGYGRSDRREALLPYPTREVVSAFGRHHDPEVVEYSTWSLFRAQGTTDRDSALSCDDFFDRPSNVRRWHYPLLAKTTSSFRRNLEFF